MIDGMSEICIDCVHQEVCRYECHRPSEHCNDRAVADDFRPHGKWIIDGHHRRCNRCNEYICNTDIEGNKIPDNFCSNCGADMREANNETRK